jgi:hypothetical protein
MPNTQPKRRGRPVGTTKPRKKDAKLNLKLYPEDKQFLEDCPEGPTGWIEARIKEARQQLGLLLFP